MLKVKEKMDLSKLFEVDNPEYIGCENCLFHVIMKISHEKECTAKMKLKPGWTVECPRGICNEGKKNDKD